MTNLVLPPWVVAPAILLLVCGGLFAFIGSLGLLRMRSFYTRMHPPTMSTTLGTGCVLIASMLVSSALAQRVIVHELLIAVCILITSPVSAMALISAAMHRARSTKDDAGNVRK